MQTYRLAQRSDGDWHARVLLRAVLQFLQRDALGRHGGEAVLERHRELARLGKIKGEGQGWCLHDIRIANIVSRIAYKRVKGKPNP